MDSFTHTRRVEQRWRRAKHTHTGPYMEQTLTLNSVSHEILESSSFCPSALLCCLVMPSSSFTLSPLPTLLSFFGLFVAPVVSFERHTVVSLCGLSEECFDQCQLNSHVLYDTHCAALYSKMCSSIYVRMRADFKLDVIPKGFCEVTSDYCCELHIKGCLWAFGWTANRTVALHSPWEVTLFAFGWWHREKLDLVKGKPRS